MIMARQGLYKQLTAICINTVIINGEFQSKRRLEDLSSKLSREPGETSMYSMFTTLSDEITSLSPSRKTVRPGDLLLAQTERDFQTGKRENVQTPFGHRYLRYHAKNTIYTVMGSRLLESYCTVLMLAF